MLRCMAARTLMLNRSLILSRACTRRRPVSSSWCSREFCVQEDSIPLASQSEMLAKRLYNYWIVTTQPARPSFVCETDSIAPRLGFTLRLSSAVSSSKLRPTQAALLSRQDGWWQAQIMQNYSTFADRAVQLTVAHPSMSSPALYKHLEVTAAATQAACLPVSCPPIRHSAPFSSTCSGLMQGRAADLERTKAQIEPGLAAAQHVMRQLGLDLVQCRPAST